MFHLISTEKREGVTPMLDTVDSVDGMVLDDFSSLLWKTGTSQELKPSKLFDSETERWQSISCCFEIDLKKSLLIN